MNFYKKFQESLNIGLESSKELLLKAKDKAKDISDIGILKYEMKQLENILEKNLTKIGSAVYQILQENGQNTVSKKTPGVKELLQEVEDTRKKIEEKQKEIKDLS